MSRQGNKPRCKECGHLRGPRGLHVTHAVPAGKKARCFCGCHETRQAVAA